MPLPTIEVPQYNLNLFSTGEDIVYRPFLVKEEKILLIVRRGRSRKYFNCNTTNNRKLHNTWKC